VNVPTTLKYTKTDEWIKVDGNFATIGITDYAQEHLSDVVYVEYPVAEDDAVVKGDVIVTVESVKAAAEVNAPISGKVLEVNEALIKKTGLVNSDPYGEAWMIKLEIDQTADLMSLMEPGEYEKYCQERS
jgi:glycine cleavage system H protein